MGMGEQYLHEAAHTEQVSDMSNMDRITWKKKQGEEGAVFGDQERYGWTIGGTKEHLWIQGGQGVDVQAWPISGYDPETSWADYFYSDDIQPGQWAYPIDEDGINKWKIFEEGDTATIEADAHRHGAQMRINKLNAAHARDELNPGQEEYELFDKAPMKRMMNPRSREDVSQNAMWSIGIDLPPINKRDEAAEVRDRIFQIEDHHLFLP
tara:strand:- start:527 stop:1153 length:627 start_codon:yes stop_codon:yes gene_type:complete